MPTVAAFWQGQIADLFQGAVPESEVKRFVETLLKSAGGAMPTADLIAEARALVAGGAREITLLGQNVNAWTGEDDAGGWSLFVPVSVSGLAGQMASSPAAIAVNRGDAVSLAVSGRGFSVSRPAEALEAGAAGAWIRVRPVTDRQLAEDIVRAQVVRPGLVVLPGN